MDSATIPGYTYGSAAAAPLSLADLALLQTTVLWGEADERALRLAGEVLDDQIEDVLDVWYGFVGSHPHLLHYFANPAGQPIAAYLGRVRARFGQWIRDTCSRPYDQDWLNYQLEIGRRHHVAGKNQTDGVDSAALIGLRYIIAFIVPITATMREFLGRKGHAPADVEAMHQAWFKAVVLQVTLWSHPFVREGQF
ncbi:MAG TPA: protoglobin domain-containing protein [Herpetosiphonaceae bacterium]|nr:protoglobin domain-containing protein [Herpetosiphonaceae bacterium]